MSRDNSPTRVKEKEKKRLTFNHDTLHQQIYDRFSPFQHWSAHILLSKPTRKADFCIGKHGTAFSYGDCIYEMTSTAWKRELRLPAAEDEFGLFVFLCIALDSAKFGFRFQIWYHYFLTRVLHPNREFDWNLCRYRLAKSIVLPHRFAFVSLLAKDRVPYTIQPNDLHQRKLIKLERFINYYGSITYPELSSQYSDAKKQIEQDLLVKLARLGIQPWETFYTELLTHCYENEIFFSNLDRLEKLLLLLSFAQAVNLTWLQTSILDKIRNKFSPAEITNRLYDITASLWLNSEQLVQILPE